MGSEMCIRDRYLTGCPERLSELGSSLSVKLQPGELFLSIAATVGKPCITAIKACIHDGFVYFPQLTIPNKFLYYVFIGGHAYAGLGKLGTQLNLNTDTVARIKVALGTEEEVASVVEFLDYETAKIDALIAMQQQLIALLGEKRQAVISHAVTKGLNPDAPMRDSGVQWLGKVPEHWTVVKLKHLVALPIIDGPHESPIKYDEGIPFISAEAIGGGYIDFEKKWGYISEEDHLRYKKRYVSTKGDILMVKLGATTGVVAIVETDEEFNVWVPLAVIRCNELADSHFVLNVLRSRNLINAYEVNWTYGTQQTLGLRTIENLHIPLPPPKEQEAIASELAARLPQLELLSQKAVDAIEVMRERRTALISAAVTGKIDVRGWKPPSSDVELETEMEVA